MLSFPYIAPSRYRIASNDWLGYSALVDDLGREIPITREMVDRACDSLVAEVPTAHAEAGLDDWYEEFRPDEPEPDEGVDGLDLG